MSSWILALRHDRSWPVTKLGNMAPVSNRSSQVRDYELKEPLAQDQAIKIVVGDRGRQGTHDCRQFDDRDDPRDIRVRGIGMTKREVSQYTMILRRRRPV